MAISAVAAIASSAAVATGVVTVSTLATISTVVTLVGAATGSKTLTKLGMGMGLASVGSSLISAATENTMSTAFAAGADESAAETARLAAKEQIAANAANEASAWENLAKTGTANMPPTAIADAGSNLAANQSTEGIINSAFSSSQNPAAAAAQETAQAASTATPAQQALGDVGPSVDIGPKEIAGPASPADVATPGSNIKDGSSFFGGIKDTLDKVGSWADKNKTLASGLMNLGGGLARGIGQAYEADRTYSLRKDMLGMEQQQAANAKAQPTISIGVNPNVNVHGNPPVKYAGIIAGARG